MLHPKLGKTDFNFRTERTIEIVGFWVAEFEYPIIQHQLGYPFSNFTFEVCQTNEHNLKNRTDTLYILLSSADKRKAGCGEKRFIYVSCITFSIRMEKFLEVTLSVVKYSMNKEAILIYQE